MSTHELIELGRELDAGGFAGRELAIRRMVRDARSAGFGTAAVDVLADTSASDVVRFRAFAVVSSTLARVAAAPALIRTVA